MMTLALLGGVLLALGHHEFYASLDRKAVQTGSYHFAGSKLSKQQVNTAVGTAFAFLVKALLGLAVSAAYIQIFWQSTKHAEQYPTLSDLDWAKAALANIFSLFNLKIWWKYPLLLLLAVVFWCVPIATVFPPATLSVESALRPPWSMRQVPQFDYTTLNYAAELDYIPPHPADIMGVWTWEGPSQAVQHTALAVMGLGQILPLTPPALNASWKLEFWGPALQCNDVAQIDKEMIWTNIWNSYRAFTATGAYTFLSWVPWYIPGSNESHPELPFICDNNYKTCMGPPGPSTLGISLGQPASLIVAVLPKAQNLSIIPNNTGGPNGFATGANLGAADCTAVQIVDNIADSVIHGCQGAQGSTFKPSVVFQDATLLQCNLVNTSYSVDFPYLSGAQSIHVSPNTTGSSPVVNAKNFFIGPSPLEPFRPEQANCTTFQVQCKFGTFEAPKSNPCVFDGQALRLLSYQGIMAAFNQLVLGAIQSVFASGQSKTNTAVMQTILSQTKELGFFRDWNPTYKLEELVPLPTILTHNNKWASLGLMNPELPRSRGDLRSTLEKLFQNYTISLLAESYLQPNYSSPFAPPQFVNVSLETYHNIYHYDRATLWIAYGLAAFFTLLAVIAGMAALLLNGASYSDSFSTMVRISRTAELSVEVMDYDEPGQDPLPTYLRHARINLGTSTATVKAVKTAEDSAEEQSLVSSSSDAPSRPKTIGARVRYKIHGR